MPEFFIIIAQKIFLPNFRGAHADCRPTPVSYAYATMRHIQGRHIGLESNDREELFNTA